MGATKHHSTDNPFEVVTAVQGHDALHCLAEVAGDLRIRDGQPYVYDYTAEHEVPVTTGHWLVRDPRGLRLVATETFVKLFGEALSYNEIKRWSNATPVAEYIREPVKVGKVTVKNGRTSRTDTYTTGDTDEEMVANAVAKGRKIFGEDADLEISLGEYRNNNLNRNEPGKWSVAATIKRR